MTDPESVPEIRYYARADAKLFWNNPAIIAVSSSVDKVDLRVSAYVRSSPATSSSGVWVPPEFFPTLIDVLSDLRQHVGILDRLDVASVKTKKRLGPIALNSQYLRVAIGDMSIVVTRQSGLLGGHKHMAEVVLDGLVIEQELNDGFFTALDRFKEIIEQLEELVEQRVQDHMRQMSR